MATQQRTGVRPGTDEPSRSDSRAEALEHLRALETLLHRSRGVLFLLRVADGWPFEFISDSIRQFGYEPADILAGRVAMADFVHPDDVARLEAEAAEHFASGVREYDQEYRIVTATGDVRWARGHNIILRDASGKPTHIQGLIFDVTEQRLAEQGRDQERAEALRKSEERYHNVYTTAPLAFVLWGLDCRVTDWNSQAEELFGWTRDEALGRNFFEFLLPEGERPERESVVGALLSGEFPARGVSRNVRKNGETVICEWNSSILRDAAGRVTGAMSLALDITERRRGERALRESEERFRQLAENIRDVFWMTTPDNSEVLYVSPAIESVWGLSKEELRENPLAWAEAIHPRDRDRVLAAFSRQAEGAVSTMEYRIVRPDGSKRWVRDRGYPIRNEQGEVYRVVGIAEDITEQRRAEKALRLSERQYRTTVDSLSDAIHVVDADLRILLANNALREWNARLGLDDEPVGKPLFELCPFLDEGVRDEYRRVFETGEIVATTETNYHGGRAIHTDTRKVPIVEDDQVVRVITVVRDVSRELRAEEELRRAERLDSLGLLAGGIAHDFNNMLMGIMANVSVARLDSRTESDMADVLHEAEKAIMRAKDLTHQLLIFSKGGAPVRQAASVVDLLRDTTEFALAGSNVRSQFRFPGDLWAADVDPAQISQVVQNLVTNAAQAMPHGGVVEVSAENVHVRDDELLPLKAGPYARIVVRDHGAGIAVEDMPKIFDPYYTTKGAGSGLGLAICHSIVRKHDGHIRMESQEGVGTTVEVLLPASEHAATPLAAPAAPSPTGCGRILVMDDEEVIRRGVSRMLRRVGYEVECAENGAEAVETYRTALRAGQRFDAVLLDLTVPDGLGGEHCFGQLRELDPDVRAIVSSGYSEDPVMADFQRHGFHGVARKPYTLEELVDALNEAMAD